MTDQQSIHNSTKSTKKPTVRESFMLASPIWGENLSKASTLNACHGPNNCLLGNVAILISQPMISCGRKIGEAAASSALLNSLRQPAQLK